MWMPASRASSLFTLLSAVQDGSRARAQLKFSGWQSLNALHSSIGALSVAQVALVITARRSWWMSIGCWDHRVSSPCSYKQAATTISRAYRLELELGRRTGSLGDCVQRLQLTRFIGMRNADTVGKRSRPIVSLACSYWSFIPPAGISSTLNSCFDEQETLDSTKVCIFASVYRVWIKTRFKWVFSHNCNKQLDGIAEAAAATAAPFAKAHNATIHLFTTCLLWLRATVRGVP